MDKIDNGNSFVVRLLFPRTPALRVFYHVCFWVLFLLLHYAYAIPTLASQVSDPRVTVSSFLYFSKVIPEYYLCVALFNLLRKYLKGVTLAIVLLLTIVVLKHMLSVLLFLFVDYAFDLKNMPERFKLVAGMYLSPFHILNLRSWLVFAYDISEIELLLLPAAFKVAKYAAIENILRQKLQNEALTMELKVLKSQINPHFVFNVLNAAYAKILPVAEDAAEYLQKASGILRFALYEANDEFIKLDKEIQYIKHYVELESIRSTRRCKIDLVQHGEIDDAHQIPTFLLITLVENAFKHGVHATRHNSYVDIHIGVTPELLEFSITNSKPNVPTMRKGNRETSGGIGLVNLKKRLEMYYPDNHLVEKTTTAEEYKVSIKLPLK
ncbi:MAG: histidine kinase [Dyadobacter sp.]|uniref:sensor histidine kinase n=1 Tax=Dyadobacter sp. TaxID=1914288 RepID=UPI00326768A4